LLLLGTSYFRCGVGEVEIKIAINILNE